jgi:hypothetical protein
MVGIAGSGDPSMPKFQRIDDGFREFIQAQKVFFVATAAPEGRVNVPAKGMDTLRVVGPNRIVWLNLTGAAHLVESPRMTLMWCSFEARTLVLRACGRAKVFHPRANEWRELIFLFPPLPGARQILDLDVDLVMTSCGFGVPSSTISVNGKHFYGGVKRRVLRVFTSSGKNGTSSALMIGQPAYLQTPINSRQRDGKGLSRTRRRLSA